MGRSRTCWKAGQLNSESLKQRKSLGGLLGLIKHRNGKI